MKKILRTTIVCLLIPSLVFAQISQFGKNEPSVKQTDLARVWIALNTEVGQQIVSYIETSVGSIDLEHAKAFMIANSEIAFVPIMSFSKMTSALCYRQLADGSEYLFLITYNAPEKAVSFTFPSGLMYVMKSSGDAESTNPDFQFQQYDDLHNKIRINLAGSDFSQLICVPFCLTRNTIMYSVAYMATIFCKFTNSCSEIGAGYFGVIFAIAFVVVAPVLLIFTIFTAYPSNSNLKLISIFLALYTYNCLVSHGPFDFTCWP
jgi:hypothetical protein